MKKIAVVAIILLVSVWFFYTPYIAAYNMKKAAEINDSAALSSYINFPSLKESLKANINAMFAEEFVVGENSDPMEALGAALAVAFINPMIDALVTPESLSMMMKGIQPDFNQDKSKSENQPNDNSDTETTMGYESFDRFAVSVKEKGNPAEPMIFVFHREGLINWKLASLRLPSPKKEKEQQAAAEPEPELLQKQPPQDVDLSSYVGQHPSEIFNEVYVQEKFKVLLGDDYDRFVMNINVASELELQDNFYFGSGCAAHLCGIDESAFAIDTETGEVFASIITSGETIQAFGVTTEQNLPPPLYAWYVDKGGPN